MLSWQGEGIQYRGVDEEGFVDVAGVKRGES